MVAREEAIRRLEDVAREITELKKPFRKDGTKRLLLSPYYRWGSFLTGQ